MTTRRPIVWMIVLCFCCAPQATAGMLIGASLDGTIYDVDPATGLATNPRESGLDTIVELAFSPDGDLFAADANVVYRIPPGGNLPETVVDLTSVGGLFGIAFDPSTAVLYGSVNLVGIPLLYTLDIETGTTTLIGDHVFAPGAIAIDLQGRLFLRASSFPTVLEIDKITARVLNTATLSLDLGRAGMTFSEDGTLFIVDGEADATDMLYTLDPTTGILTSIGHTGLDNGLVGLAYIPEPSTLALLVVGVVVSVRSRRFSRSGR